MEKQRKRRALGRIYDRSLGRILPSERLFAVLFCLLLNSIVYWGGQHIAADFPHWDMTTALDRMIPLVPGWVFVYVGAFPFWAVNYVLMARGQDWYRIMTAEVLAKLICGVVFLALPTTNVRPALTGDGFGEMLLQLVYEMDAPTNLLPSIHCLESWICFAGLRGRRDIPLWYRGFSGVFAVLVCISTLTTYQHVIVDVIAGVLLAEVLLRIAKKKRFGRRLKWWFIALDGAWLGERAS